MGLSREPTEETIRRFRQRVENLTRCFRVCMLINSSLDLDEVLSQIMSTSRAVMNADACSLMLADEESGELVFQVAQGSVGEKLREEVRLKRGEGIAGYVFETGRPLIIEDAYKDPRFNPDVDRRTGYRTRSILCVPLIVKDRIIGVSQVINKLDGTPFNQDDLEAFSLLSAQAAIAIENARMHRDLLRRQRIESDLAFATQVQKSFLPQEVPNLPGYRFQTHYQSAMAVGGDFFDFIPLSQNRLGILIGDVAGKGVSSALYMARLTSDFRFHALRERSASRVVQKVNELLCERSRRGMFVTLLYGILHVPKRTLTYVNAGHIPPVLWNSRDGVVRVLPKAGDPPLGILRGRTFRSARLRLQEEDCLLLTTDGILDARNPRGEQFGWDRLQEAMRRGDGDARSVHRRILAELNRFLKGARLADDVTLVLMGVEPMSWT